MRSYSEAFRYFHVSCGYLQAETFEDHHLQGPDTGAESIRKVRVGYHPLHKFCLPILDSYLIVQHTEIGKYIFK